MRQEVAHAAAASGSGVRLLRRSSESQRVSAMSCGDDCLPQRRGLPDACGCPNMKERIRLVVRGTMSGTPSMHRGRVACQVWAD